MATADCSDSAEQCGARLWLQQSHKPCGASHYCARLLRGLGHEVVLLPPQYIKPYVKRGKNDANDAEAICEAMSRPGMRFVPIKSAECQAELMLLGVRDLPADRAAPARSKPRRFSAVFRDRTIEHRDGAV